MTQHDLLDSIQSAPGVSTLDIFAKRVEQMKQEGEFTFGQATIFESALKIREEQIILATWLADQIKTSPIEELPTLVHLTGVHFEQNTISQTDYNALMLLGKSRTP